MYLIEKDVDMCPKHVDTFTKTFFRESKMAAVACAELAFQC